jgi:hypothetical protein
VSISGPDFSAWSAEAERVDALAAALSALGQPNGRCSFEMNSYGLRDSVQLSSVSIDEAIAATRSGFSTISHAFLSLSVRLRSERWVPFIIECNGDEFARRARGHAELFRAGAYDIRDIYGDRLELALDSGPRSVETEAAVVTMQVHEDTEDLLLRLCAPAHAFVRTGACTGTSIWIAPLELPATYHADATGVARDIALSWLHLHDGTRVDFAAALPMDVLATRVEAAPRGASIGVSSKPARRDDHACTDWATAKVEYKRPTRPDAIRDGPRAILPSDDILTREQVLKALSMQPAALLDALEAAAVPSHEWTDTLPHALEMIEAKKQGKPTLEVNVSTGKHHRFIERCAPYHVRRLPNGGVLLATHPYRTLWQLWADALLLLGIRTDASDPT